MIGKSELIEFRDVQVSHLQFAAQLGELAADSTALRRLIRSVRRQRIVPTLSVFAFCGVQTQRIQNESAAAAAGDKCRAFSALVSARAGFIVVVSALACSWRSAALKGAVS